MVRQLSLFDSSHQAASRIPAIDAVEPSPETRDLARRLPPGVRLGTSSWHFPGWRGLVWAQAYEPGELSRGGLQACARHPLLTAAGIDRSFYAPLPARQYASYAAQVPAHFRFVVKAPGRVTHPWLSAEGDNRGVANAEFLDPAFATEEFVTPVIAGLGTRAGTLLFQFPPLGRTLTRSPERFIGQLQNFLSRLPPGPRYAVEVRDARILTRRFFASLKEAGAGYCIGLHPRMPPVTAQAAAMAGFGPGPLLIRWNLSSSCSYEAARDRFTPFDRLIEEDVATRESIARLVVATVASGEECTIIVNNKAEGSAPLTLLGLARAIVASARARAAQD